MEEGARTELAELRDAAVQGTDFTNGHKTDIVAPPVVQFAKADQVN
jgi:hypothetical protein